MQLSLPAQALCISIKRPSNRPPMARQPVILVNRKEVFRCPLVHGSCSSSTSSDWEAAASPCSPTPCVITTSSNPETKTRGGFKIMSQTPTENRGSWGSRIGYILSSLGMAVGVGAIWRFPTMTAMWGGGSFVLAFAVICLIIVIPAGWCECALGRKYKIGRAHV